MAPGRALYRTPYCFVNVSEGCGREKGKKGGKPFCYSRAGSVFSDSVGCWVAMETRRIDRTCKGEAWCEDKL